MNLKNDTIKFPLETLIKKLRDEGFEIDIDTQVKMYEILYMLGPEYSILKIGSLLSPIVSKNWGQQNKFHEIFNDYSTELLNYEYPEIIKPPIKKTEPANKKKSLILIGFILVIGFLSFLIFSKPQDVDNEVITNDVETSISLDDIYPVFLPRQALVSADANKTYKLNSNIKLILLLTIGGVSFLIYILSNKFRFIWHFRNNPIPNIIINRKPPYEIKLNNQLEKVITNNEEYDFLADSTKRTYVDSKKIDLVKTILRTIKSCGGFDDFVWKTESNKSKYLVLISYTKFNNKRSELFEYFLDEIINKDLIIEKFRYYKDPRFCYNESQPHGLHISELFNDFPEHNLIIFGEVESLISPYSKELTNWAIENLLLWENRTFITSYNIDSWGYDENYLQKKFNIIPNNLKSITTASVNLNCNMDVTSTEIDDLNITGEIFKLKNRLNTDLFLWTIALAVLDNINLQLVITIGKELEKRKLVNNDLVSFPNLYKIINLKFLDEDEINLMMRNKLISELKKYPQVERCARESVLLLYEKTNVPKNSYAELVKEEQLLKQKIELNPRSRKNRNAVQVLKKNGLLTDFKTSFSYYSNFRKFISTGISALLSILSLYGFTLFLYDSFTVHYTSLILSVGSFVYNKKTINNLKINISWVFLNIAFIVFTFTFSVYIMHQYLLIGSILFLISIELFSNHLNRYYETANKKPNYRMFRFFFYSVFLIAFITNIDSLITQTRFKDMPNIVSVDTSDIENYKLFNDLGIEAFNKLEINKAIAYFNKSIDLDKTNSIAMYNKSVLEYNLGVDYFNIDSTTQAHLFFANIDNDSLKPLAKRNLDLIGFKVGELNEIVAKDIRDSLNKESQTMAIIRDYLYKYYIFKVENKNPYNIRIIGNDNQLIVEIDKLKGEVLDSSNPLYFNLLNMFIEEQDEFDNRPYEYLKYLFTFDNSGFNESIEIVLEGKFSSLGFNSNKDTYQNMEDGYSYFLERYSVKMRQLIEDRVSKTFEFLEEMEIAPADSTIAEEEDSYTTTEEAR